MTSLYPQQIQGLTIKPPVAAPQPGQVIIGYERFKHEADCCNCEGMTQDGLITIFILILTFWPLAFIPCLIEDCREEYQRPVYGNPRQAPAVVGYMPPVAPKAP
eukprot:TRINITY_DN3546_c0_g2_i4.p3 TRINITY_DN3546_c0_g2~~TRINITY_DN3546_c0_g2_i4.p3  ORF type:complete len:122 (+),score=6.80 TRINITY_DN3546_c0_g2_i4:57-368(+)